MDIKDLKNKLLEDIQYQNYSGTTTIEGNLEGIDQNFKDELSYSLSLIKGNIEKGLNYHTKQNKKIKNMQLNINENGKVDCVISFI